MKKQITLILAAALALCSCAKADKPRISQNSPAPLTSLTVAGDIEEDSIDSEPDEPSSDDGYTPLNYDEQKAVWISYIDLAGIIADTETKFRENITEVFDNIAELGLNTVYVHVRAFGDAYYMSSLYPLNRSVPTEEGTPLYDPLRIMTELAHERELSFHAWINPLRLTGDTGMESFTEESVIYKAWSDPDEYPDYLTKPADSDVYWIDPAYPELRKYIADGAAEICGGYDIDGIHIDDYFYPTTEAYFDDVPFAVAQAEDDSLELTEWRMNNCSLLVSEIYSAVKAVDERILFGVSPQGNIENNYSLMYADVGLWCSKQGYLDYICPQIYFGYNNTVCPFTETLQRWEDMVTADGVKLVCGLGLYQAERDNEFITDTGIIARQIEDSTSGDKCSGFAIYSYVSLFNKNTQRFDDEREAISAMIQ